MAQYTSFTVSVTSGSPTVTGAVGTKFLTNAAVGNAFKVKGDSVVYTISNVVSDTILTLSTNYQGTTNSVAQYQVTRDYTPTLGLAEVNVGDQDWPVHLTQETIRKIDSALGPLKQGTAVRAAATDLASVITLVNQLRSALIAAGVCS